MSTRFRLLFALGLASLAIGAAARALLWWNYGTTAGVGALALPAILAGGLINDAIVALYLFTPLALYTALLPDRWTEELNFIGWEPVNGKAELDLPAKAALRITLQWQEAHDPEFMRRARISTAVYNLISGTHRFCLQLRSARSIRRCA